MGPSRFDVFLAQFAGAALGALVCVFGTRAAWYANPLLALAVFVVVGAILGGQYAVAKR